MIRRNGRVYSGGSPGASSWRPPRVKKMILLAAAVAVPLAAAAVLGPGAPETPAVPGDFVTVWETTLPGESVTFPGLGTYTIDWGDGAVGANVTGPQTHAYAAAGSHTVSVSGLSRIFGDCQTGAQKLKSIEQWGNASWTGMHRAFCGASHMTHNAPDAPDLSRVTDMSGMFLGAAAFDGDLSQWDVAGVTDMNGMFSFATAFDGNVSDWDVSQVTDMGRMFSFAGSFDGDVSDWDVSQVTDMDGMFLGAAAFDGDVSDWDVSQVTDMSEMFSSAGSFDGDVSDWDVSQVTDMNSMFSFAGSFDGDLSDWDVSQVTDMNGMFNSADSFRQNLGNWYVVPADASYSSSEGTLNATTVSAQNPVLDGHSPEYGIGSGGDSGLFEMAGNALVFRDAPSARGHAVNVTASGHVFEDGNNWRMLEITVTGGDPPTIPLAGDGAISWRFAASDGAASDGAAAFGPAATIAARDAPMTASPAAYPWGEEARAARIGIIDAPDATPVTVDPEPGMVDSAAAPDIVDPDPMEDQDSTGRALPVIHTWPGFEPESGAQLLASLEPDYPGLDVPDWVMTELGPLVAKDDITVGEFKTALEYVLEHVLEHS